MSAESADFVDAEGPDAALSLQAFLSDQPAAVLAAKLWQWAQSMPQLMIALEVWAQHSQQALPGAANQAPALASLPAVSKLKRQISDSVAEVYRNAHDGYDSNPDLSALEALLDQLQTLSDQPVVLRDLCVHLWEEMAPNCDELQYDEGELHSLLTRLLNLLHQTLTDAPPAADWFDTWMALMGNDPLGLWDEAQALAMVGPAVQARYIETARSE